MLVVLIAALLGLGLSENRRAIQKRADETGEILANTVFGSIIGPMAIGDGDTIRRQMEDFRSGMHGVDVAVFGFDRTITYASEKTTLGAELGRHLSSAELSGAVDQLLKTGRVAQHSFELEKYAMPRRCRISLALIFLVQAGLLSVIVCCSLGGGWDIVSIDNREGR